MEERPCAPCEQRLGAGGAVCHVAGYALPLKGRPSIISTWTRLALPYMCPMLCLGIGAWGYALPGPAGFVLTAGRGGAGRGGAGWGGTGGRGGAGVKLWPDGPAGFPSLKSRRFAFDITNCRVNVFGRPSSTRPPRAPQPTHAPHPPPAAHQVRSSVCRARCCARCCARWSGIQQREAASAGRCSLAAVPRRGC
jgi:hypothetical protein